jgi:hypothetical protein
LLAIRRIPACPHRFQKIRLLQEADTLPSPQVRCPVAVVFRLFSELVPLTKYFADACQEQRIALDRRPCC